MIQVNSDTLMSSEIFPGVATSNTASGVYTNEYNDFPPPSTNKSYSHTLTSSCTSTRAIDITEAYFFNTLYNDIHDEPPDGHIAFELSYSGYKRTLNVINYTSVSNCDSGPYISYSLE